MWSIFVVIPVNEGMKPRGELVIITIISKTIWLLYPDEPLPYSLRKQRGCP
jgi:hypothetical protein